MRVRERVSEREREREEGEWEREGGREGVPCKSSTFIFLTQVRGDSREKHTFWRVVSQIAVEKFNMKEVFNMQSTVRLTAVENLGECQVGLFEHVSIYIMGCYVAFCLLLRKFTPVCG